MSTTGESTCNCEDKCICVTNWCFRLHQRAFGGLKVMLHSSCFNCVQHFDHFCHNSVTVCDFFSHPGCIGWDWMVWWVRKSQGNSTCVFLDHTSNVCTGSTGTSGTMQGKAQDRPQFRGDAWLSCCDMWCHGANLVSRDVVMSMHRLHGPWCYWCSYYLFGNYHAVHSLICTVQ